MREFKIALVGNPNCGKTSIFNELTGVHQRIGNWPGVTVERLEGEFEYRDVKFKVTDLPGVYSLSSISLDEKIAQDYILSDQAELYINIIDSSNLQRSLYLTMQLLETGAKIIAVFNMYDRLEHEGKNIDLEKFYKLLGIYGIKTVAYKGRGIEELKSLLYDIAAGNKRVDVKDIKYTKVLEQMVARGREYGFNKYEVLSALSGDPVYRKKCEDAGLKQLLEECEKEIKLNYGLRPELYIVEQRYAVIRGIYREIVQRVGGARLNYTEIIDRIVLNKILALPILFLIVFVMFKITFGLGDPIAEIIDSSVALLAERLKMFLSPVLPPVLISLLADGIISGVGAVGVFFPYIFILYFVMTLLEDSGYMARVAFVMDRIMHFFGLHGKSFIPIILGFGCNVPAILATRTIESRKDRLLTILIIPFITCSARLPVYTVIIGAFFTKYESTVLLGIYFFSVVIAIFSAFILSKIIGKRGLSAPFVMELPKYHLPTIRGLFIHTWERAKHFLYKMGHIIVIASIIIWILSSMPFGVEYGSKGSIIGRFGQIFAPILKPLGLGDWRILVALLFGVFAKEIVVSTFGTLFGATGAGLMAQLKSVMTMPAAIAFLLFVMLYTPCVGTIAAIKNETGSYKITIIAVLYELLVAWGIAFVAYNIFKLILA